MATNFTKKTAAIALAAGLAFSGSAGIVAAPVAQAQAVSDIANITDGTITVHKKKNPESIGNPNADGTASAASGEALNGATFKIEKINVNMSTEAGFKDASELQVTNDTVDENDQVTARGVNKAKLDALGIDPNFPAVERTTEGNGELVFDNLPGGAYLITEIGITADNAADETYVPSAPFVVFVPMPMDGPNNTKTWNKNVHVYPKNSQLTPEKTVKDAGQNPANDTTKTLEYTLTSNVPVLPPQRTLTELSLVDTYLASEFENGLNIKPETANQTWGVRIVKANNDVIQLQESQYSIDGPTALAENEKKKAGDKVTADTARKITVTDKELLKTLQNGDKLEVILVGDVQKVQQNNTGDGIKDGEVTNYVRTAGKTEVTGKPGWDDKTFKTPEKQVQSYFAAVRLIKHRNDVPKDAQGNPNYAGIENEDLLGGAEFDIYSVPAGKACGDDDRTAITSVTTAGEGPTKGKAVVNSLHVVDFVDGKPVGDAAAQIKFCAVETKAPEGYQLNETPFELSATMNEATTPQTLDTLTFSSTASLKNEERGIPQLPQTGGMGVLALILAGLALLGGGAYAARRKTA